MTPVGRTPDVEFILLNFADGTVGIMQFVLDDHRIVRQEATDENVQAQIKRSPFSQPVNNWRRMDQSEIPADRTFRNAWVDGGTTVAVDMPKARDLHRDRIRSDRALLFSQLDVAYARADEAGDTEAKAAIAAQKQALRDAPAHPDIEAAQTPEDLLAARPPALDQPVNGAADGGTARYKGGLGIVKG